MNIVVCVKYVPDATADRKFEDDFTVDRVGVDGLLSELDEYAVEQALQDLLGDPVARRVGRQLPPQDTLARLQFIVQVGRGRQFELALDGGWRLLCAGAAEKQRSHRSPRRGP